MRFTESHLKMRLRQQGISKIADVKTATLEPNGQLGYELTREAKPVTIGELENILSSYFSNNMTSPSTATNTSSTSNIFNQIKEQSIEVNYEQSNKDNNTSSRNIFIPQSVTSSLYNTLDEDKYVPTFDDSRDVFSNTDVKDPEVKYNTELYNSVNNNDKLTNTNNPYSFNNNQDSTNTSNISFTNASSNSNNKNNISNNNKLP